MNDFLTLENQLCFALYETNSLFQKLYNQTLQSYRLTYSQYLLLLALWEDDGQTMKQLGARLNLGTGTLTPMIKRMENNEWIVKQKNPADERAVCIFLAKKGKTSKADITASIAKHIQACNIDYNHYLSLMKELKELRKKISSYSNSSVKHTS